MNGELEPKGIDPNEQMTDSVTEAVGLLGVASDLVVGSTIEEGTTSKLVAALEEAEHWIAGYAPHTMPQAYIVIAKMKIEESI